MFKCPSVRLSEQPQSSAPLHSSPLEPMAPSDASSPAPVPDPGVSVSSAGAPACSAVAAALSPLSLASFQSIPDFSHHRCGTRVPRRRSTTSQSPRIGQVAMNCGTVFCLQRTNVLDLTTPASLVTPLQGGVNLLSVPPTAFDRTNATPWEGRKVGLPPPGGGYQGGGGREIQDIGPLETEYGPAIHCDLTDPGAL